MGRKVSSTAALLAAVCAVIVPSAGVASAAPRGGDAALATTLVNKTGTTVTVTAGVGRGNSISVWQVGDTIRIRDTGDYVAASGDCSAVSSTEVSCSAASTTTEVVVNAGDQNDTVTSSLAAVGVTLVGGAGDDSLYGGSANDTLEGEEGADFLSGGAGNDTLTGGAGVDRLFGGNGNDSIEGRAGADIVNAGGGNDVVDGGSGADQIVAEAGTDFVDGGSGRDVINAVDDVSGNDYVDGGADADNCSADLGDSVSNCP